MLGFLQLILKVLWRSYLNTFKIHYGPVMDQTILQNTVSNDYIAGPFGRASTWVIL